MSFLSHASPQKSLLAPSTVDARIELVPSPEPAGMAASKVISSPEPNAFRCSSNDAGDSAANHGAHPAKVGAAFGMEKGEPTFL